VNREANTPSSQVEPKALPPIPGPQAGRKALQALIGAGGINAGALLPALQAIHQEMGDIFRISLPGFSPVFLVGPQANHFVAVDGRTDLLWRPPKDPVTHLLRRGLLVTDGEEHDHLRRQLTPALHRRLMDGYAPKMLALTDEMAGSWQDGSLVDSLPEMRRLALLILFATLFDVDLRPDLHRIWPHLLSVLRYISPGLWLVFPRLPRFGYQRSIRALDSYLYELIRQRRAHQDEFGEDMLTHLVRQPDLDDDLVRDQLLTILIAGHDTSTALLTWALYLFAAYPDQQKAVQAEIDLRLAGQIPDARSTLDLPHLEAFIQECLRLYPPIHIGNRIAARDLQYGGYHIPAGARVVYSIYLTHRDPRHWPDPERFDPARFMPGTRQSPPHYAYLPFGGGPRNCIGMAFAQVEVRLILSRLLQHFTFALPSRGAPDHTRPHMGATLEPHPSPRLVVRRRTIS
jgi:cytochrome P450